MLNDIRLVVKPVTKPGSRDAEETMKALASQQREAMRIAQVSGIPLRMTDPGSSCVRLVLCSLKASPPGVAQIVAALLRNHPGINMVLEPALAHSPHEYNEQLTQLRVEFLRNEEIVRVRSRVSISRLPVPCSAKEYIRFLRQGHEVWHAGEPLWVCLINKQQKGLCTPLNTFCGQQ
jgi:hypothetical protein